MKDKLFILTAVLAIGCLAMAIRANQIVKDNQGMIDKERYKRLVAEEALQNSNAKNRSLENQLVSTKNQAQGLQALLEKEEIESKEMRKELEKMVKLNDVLEKELKEALVQVPEIQSAVEPSQP